MELQCINWGEAVDEALSTKSYQIYMCSRSPSPPPLYSQGETCVPESEESTADEAVDMPVRTDDDYTSSSEACTASVSLNPPPPINTVQPGVTTSLLYGGAQFQGYQKSKGSSYDVEVALQVSNLAGISSLLLNLTMCCVLMLQVMRKLTL